MAFTDYLNLHLLVNNNNFGHVIMLNYFLFYCIFISNP